MKPTPDFYQVQKNVPIPACTGGGRPSPLKQAFVGMQVGDSFLVPEGRMSNVWGMAKQRGFKICTRKVEKGVRRVWRIK